MIAFSDLASAAYCPRQLYYRRRDDDREVPAVARERIELAYRYPELATATDATLRRLPIHRGPAVYRRNLARMRDRPEYDHLVDPAATRTVLTGRECRGVVHKLLAGDAERAPTPVICSPGEPPEQGVWEPQSVRAVAAAKALAWEREREIPRALVEYPAVGVVRTVQLTTRRKAAYRRTVRAVRAIDGPPARVADNRCRSCAYREMCGPSRRTLRSVLRLGE